MKTCIHIGLRYKGFTLWASARNCTRRTQKLGTSLFEQLKFKKTIPLGERSKASVCGRSPAGTVGSNPAGGMDVCLWWVLCVVKYRPLQWADHSFGEVLRSEVCLNVVEEAPGRPRPNGTVQQWKQYCRQSLDIHSQRMNATELQTISSQYLFVRFKLTKKKYRAEYGASNSPRPAKICPWT